MLTLRFIILLFLGLFSSIVFADPFPDTAIQHNSIPHFVADDRLLLDVQLNDTTEIVEARCYFKTGLDKSYLYVSMDHLSGESYQCSLPAFKVGSQTLEYFFLIVNGRSQVIRSSSYTTKEADNNVAVNRPLAVVPSTILYVWSELEEIEKDDTGIVDGLVDLNLVKHFNQLYGLRAGVYERVVIPDYYNVMPGYFGGFVFDQIGNTIRPIKGFAPNLSQSLFKKLSPLDMHQNSADVQLHSSERLDIGGENWSGYFTRTNITTQEPLTATIIQEGSDVTIVTTLTDLGHELKGTINEMGDMLLYDSYDGEDWTTHYGPASSRSVNIYDYVPASPGDTETPLNVIVLVRPPQPPLAVQASDGLFLDEIAVSWDQPEGAVYYVVYACSNSSTDSCISLSEVDTNQFVDVRKVIGTVFYRIQACDDVGCSEFSDFDIGYNQLISIVPILHQLLNSN